MKIKTPEPIGHSHGFVRSSAIAFCAVAIVAAPLWAANPLPVLNAGFELPVVVNEGSTGPIPSDWTAINEGAVNVLNPSTADLSAQAPEGFNVASVTSSNLETGLGQILTSQLQANANYTLVVKVANTLFTTGFPGYRIQLVADGTVLAEDDNSQSIAEDAVITATVNYTYNPGLHAALVGKPLQIRLLSKGLVAGQEVAFDDVRLSVALGDPLANAGGPYKVAIPGGSLALDGSGSLPSDGQTITSWEWDLDNDGDFDEAITGATPASIPYATLTAAPPAGYGMADGANTIRLRVTDSAAKTSTVQGAVNLVEPLAIYEPFSDLNSTLAGNTPGLGLVGTWSGQSLVAGSSLTYGKLGYQGGRVVTNPANNVDSCGVSPGTTLTAAGLMNDGATLWFSFLAVKHADVSPATDDRKTYFSIGTGVPDGFDRIGGNTGNGFTVVFNQTNTGASRDRIQGWNNNSATTGGAFRSPLASYGAEGETILAVGKITWGAFNATPALAVNDVFELYIPDKDLNLGSPVSTLSGNFDQLGTVSADKAFDTIGFAGNRRENNVPEIDEIRFGATASSVLPLDLIGPVLVSTDNALGGGVQRVATFDEEVYLGTGEIRIVNETTPGTTTITLPDPQVVVSGNRLTIAPTIPLASGQIYHIEIDNGALTDRNLNPFAGISDPDQWEFTVDGTAPTMVSFGDNTFPKPILINSSRLVYTVTFSEPIDAATVGTDDFAATADSAPVTVGSVSPTANPAVFEVAVTTLGTTGTLTLEIVANAVIADANGNNLVTTTALPSDNTLTVNAPTPTAASLLVDFQATIASEQHPTYAGEGRYFHVSANPNNAGTGSYAATVTGLPDNVPAPVFVRKFTGPVLSYKFAGGTDNVVGTMGVGMSGGDATLITHTTKDPSYDGFAQQQAKVWNATDPGPNLATDIENPATAVADSNAGLFRSLGGAVGTINIAGLASGSVHIYYGSFSATPSVRVTMRDLDNVAADIVLSNVHLNGDAANRSEYYLAEIDFVTAGFYEVIEYEWLANGLNYEGNGRGIGTVLTGPDVGVGSPFANWSVLDGATGVTFDGDANGDGVQDGLAFLLGAANPNVDANAAGLLPTVTRSGGNLVMEFDCLATAGRGTALLNLEYDGDLVAPWLSALVPGVVGNSTVNTATGTVDFVATANGDLIHIVATISDATESAGNKLFGRLKGTE